MTSIRRENSFYVKIYRSKLQYKPLGWALKVSVMLTSFLESASHTKAATAIPALLCTIAALYKRNNIHHLKIGLKSSSCEFHGKNWAIHYRFMCDGSV